MKRSVESELMIWRHKANRLPLILQGARQVGKTYLMKWLGKNHFQQFAYFNFDERPELKEIFNANKQVDRILDQLALVSGKTMGPDTLVVLDEIQECPQALNTLKYFNEYRPEIPIICAGSLLGVTLQPGQSFPVGKVAFLQINPMSFSEVLHASHPALHLFLEQHDFATIIPLIQYNELIVVFKYYLITGGMPAVVTAFLMTKNWDEVDATLSNLIISYKSDFAKYPVMADVAKIGQVFDSLPVQLSRENKKFIFQLVKSGARARQYEDAIQWLVKSGLVHQVMNCQKPGMPLSAYFELSAFKLYAMDVGILRRMSYLNPNVFIEGNRLFTEFKGAIIENYILQSLFNQWGQVPAYWTSGNEAEVDFIIQWKDGIIPIEVKSDENVKSRSLNVYTQKFEPKLRLRYSLKNLEYRDGLLNVPHFLADYTARILDTHA